MKRSPLAPAQFPELHPVDGLRFSVVAAGVRYNERADVMLAELDEGSQIAGVFTRSSTRSAAVLDCEAKIGSDSVDRAAILVNSGNANAFTGRAGTDAVSLLCREVAGTLGIRADRVFTSSTGVIGEPLPAGRIVDRLSHLHETLSADGAEAAADAMRTTDTFAKGSSRIVQIDERPVTITGIAKGSGMIAPDMATMLVYIFTDAQIDRASLQVLTRTLADLTFNCITVDSDTSTSDTLLVAATGKSKVDVTESVAFTQALHEVMLDLAHQVVRDGEGATKFVSVEVSGALSDSEARLIGQAIANSPLVKTAIAGEDPNWGRVVMAVGKSGATADRDKLSIRFGDIPVAEDGWVAKEYDETAAAAYMKNDEITIGVDIGLGGGVATIWTCDLTHGYIDINADYRS